VFRATRCTRVRYVPALRALRVQAHAHGTRLPPRVLEAQGMGVLRGTGPAV